MKVLQSAHPKLIIMSYSMKFVLLVGVISLALTQAKQNQVIDTGKVQPDTLVKAVPDNTRVNVDTMMEEIDAIKYDKYSVTADLSDFPTLHPIVVHFAVSLIVFAAFLQLLNVILIKKDLVWTVLLLILAGFISAILSSRNFHPQTTGLAQRAAIVLEMHDKWAIWTIRTALLAIILQVVYLFIAGFDKVSMNIRQNMSGLKKRNRIFMLLIAIIMIVSAYCVVHAGHLGAQLVHIEGVGPQGKYLEEH
jgi:hypothetical protein